MRGASVELASADGDMAATAEALRRAGKHAKSLRKEAEASRALEREGPELIRVLEAIVSSVVGREEGQDGREDES